MMHSNTFWRLLSARDKKKREKTIPMYQVRDSYYDWGTNKARIRMRGSRLDRFLLPRVKAGKRSTQSMRYFDKRMHSFYNHWSKN